MKKENKKLKIITILLTVFLFWGWGWVFIDQLLSIDQLVSFGYKLDFVNLLLSGLALAVIIYSIFFQQKELNIQRKELAKTRSEFKNHKRVGLKSSA